MELPHLNSEILKELDEDIGSLPENFSFCEDCLKTKTKQFEDEIKHLESYNKAIADCNKDKDEIINANTPTSKNDPYNFGTPLESPLINSHTIDSRILMMEKNISYSETKVERNFDSRFSNLNNLNLSKLSSMDSRRSSNLRLIDTSADEKIKMQAEIEALHKEKNETKTKIIELIEQVETFEDKHQKVLEEINEYEIKMISIKRSLSDLNARKELFERKLDHLRNFSVLNEAFKIEINDHIGKINGLEIGVLAEMKEAVWMHINSAFGNVMLIYSYLLRKNNLTSLNSDYDTIVFPYGYDSYFFDQVADKHYFLRGPVTSDNLVVLLGKF